MSPPTSSTASAMSAALHCRRALEQQVLEEVRRPRVGVVLVARPGPHPDADRHRAGVGHRLGHEAGPALEHLGTDHRRLPARSRHRGVATADRDGASGSETPAPTSPPTRTPRTASPPRSPPRWLPRSLAAPTVAGPGPRSPSSLTSSASKAASNEATGRGRAPTPASAPLVGAADRDEPRHGRRRARPLDRRGPTSCSTRCRSAPAGLAGERQRHLALRVDVVDLHLDGPGRATRRPRPGRRACRRPTLEMWSRPSRPGRMFTKAPNLVMLTTLPG